MSDLHHSEKIWATWKLWWFFSTTGIYQQFLPENIVRRSNQNETKNDSRNWKFMVQSRSECHIAKTVPFKTKPHVPKFQKFFFLWLSPSIFLISNFYVLFSTTKSSNWEKEKNKCCKILVFLLFCNLRDFNPGPLDT